MIRLLGTQLFHFLNNSRMSFQLTCTCVHAEYGGVCVCGGWRKRFNYGVLVCRAYIVSIVQQSVLLEDPGQLLRVAAIDWHASHDNPIWQYSVRFLLFFFFIQFSKNVNNLYFLWIFYKNKSFNLPNVMCLKS